MERNRQSEGFDFGSLIIAILAFIVAFVAFRNPLVSLASIVVYYGIFAIIKGIIEIIFRNRINKYYGEGGTPLLVVGIINIIFGIILLFNLGAGMVVLPMVFAIWFLFDSIMGIFRARPIKAISNARYWIVIVLNVIGIILGIMLIGNPFASMITVAMLLGFYFVALGVKYLVNAF